MSDVRAKRVELILQQLEGLPTLPAVAVRVLETVERSGSSFNDLVDALESDPALSTKILSLVHRADLGVPGVSTVRGAVALLGFDAVRCATLSAAVFGALQQPSAESTDSGNAASANNAANASPDSPPISTAFNAEEFWKHSIAVACCAELLARRLGGDAALAALPLKPGSPAPIAPAEAFVAGLLHDIGKIALHTILPKSFGRVVEGTDLLRANIADLEQSIIGIDHLLAGKRLAERWRLPAAVRDVIWLHGQPPAALAGAPDAAPTAAPAANAALIHLVTLADILVRENHLGYSGNYILPSSTPWLAASRLSAGDVDAVMQQLVSHVERRAATLGLGKTTTGQLYRQAIARANAELDRMNLRLASRSQRLASRSKFFDHFGQFQSELRPDSSPQAVMVAAGASAAAALAIESPAGSATTAPTPIASAPAALDPIASVPVAPASADPAAAAGVLAPVAVFSLPPGRAYAQAVVVALANDTTATDSAASPQVLQTSLIDCPAAPAAPAAGDGPVLPADDLEWLLAVISPRLAGARRFWIPLLADGRCIGGVVWGGAAGESDRLGRRAPELAALAGAWALALRTAQVREESQNLAEQLGEALRRLGGAQNEIIRSKMLVSVGEMAAGAAHEMNNPLAVISGRSQLLASQISDPKLKYAATLIHEQSHRLSEIITELMEFARPVPPTPAAVDLADLVGRSLHDAKMLDDPADRTIEVTLTDMPAVLVDEAQVSAALAELIGNAIQATDPATGHVEIHAALVPAGAAEAALLAGEPAAPTVAATQKIAVTISDNGCGMDEATLRRAFDPFFSAKPAGRRRGLGLAKALRWIESSGGSIRLESRPGSGTRSLVLLPAAPAVESTGTQTLAMEHQAAAGRVARAG